MIDKEQRKENRKVVVVLAAIGAVFLFTRLFLLTSVPRGLNVDEAGMAYDAFCLANYGTDRYMTWHPVYLTNFGSGQSAMYAYLASIFIKIIGFRPAAFRLPAVCLGAAVLIFGYLIGKETMGKRSGLLLAGLITLCPYFIMASRWGLDCNLFLGFFTMSVYWLMLAVKREKPGWFALAGLSFGFSLYTYAVSYVMLPLFLFFSFLYLLWSGKLKLKQAAAFAIPLAVLAAPLLLFIAVNSGYLEPFRTPLFTIQRMDYFRAGEFSLEFLQGNWGVLPQLLSSDLVQYNGFAEFGTLYYVSVPFLLAGIVLSLIRTVKSVAGRQYDGQTFITIMFWSVMSVVMVMRLPNINKANAVYFPAVYCVVLAFDFVLGKLPWKKTLTCGVGAVYLVCFLFFARYYYFEYSDDRYPQKYFENDLRLALDLVEEEYPRGTERNIYVDGYFDIVSQPYIYTLIRRPISPEEWLAKRDPADNSYDNYRFTVPEEIIPEELDWDGIYLMSSRNEEIEKLRTAGFQEREFHYWIIFSK